MIILVRVHLLLILIILLVWVLMRSKMLILLVLMLILMITSLTGQECQVTLGAFISIVTLVATLETCYLKSEENKIGLLTLTNRIKVNVPLKDIPTCRDFI